MAPAWTQPETCPNNSAQDSVCQGIGGFCNEVLVIYGILREFKPSFRSGFGLVLDVVLGTGFDKFWEGENHGLGLTPPGFRWFSPLGEVPAAAGHHLA